MPNNEPDQEELQHRLSGMTRLVEVTCELAALHNLDRILELVTSSACEALDCERASLFLYDAAREELFTRVVTKLEIEEIRTQLDTGITGWVARRRKVANIADPHHDARWNSAVDKKTGFSTRNILATPVVSPHDERLLGVLQLLNRRDGDFDEFDEQMIRAFASHAGTALERWQLLEAARQSQELQIEIDLGRSIQTGFLPASLPEIPGYEVAAWWQPAEAVSGDYYDLITLPDGRLGLVVADVSGHGVGPSLIMASARAMLHVLSQNNSDPDKILTTLSETITPDLKEGRFITFLLVALDPASHEIRFANAGHGPALHFKRQTGEFHNLETTMLPVGFGVGSPAQPPGALTLEPGDLLVMATDGAIELRDESGRMFGRSRLENLITENKELPATQLLPVIQAAINDFHPNEHPPDDVTLLLLERKMSG